MSGELVENVSPEYREGEKKAGTKVVLEFFRHGLKEKNPDKNEAELRLTPEGRGQADRKGKKLNPEINVSLVRAPYRDRAQETGARVMLANENIGANAPLEEINIMTEEKIQNEQMLDKDYAHGIKSKKIVVDERLGFDLDGPVGKKQDEAADQGRHFQYLVEESDRDAIKTGDKKSSTYLRYAGNIAEIIDRYCKIGNNFNKLASKTAEYEKYGNRMERYLASHQGVTENFILKVLEKTGDDQNIGIAKRNKYIKALGEGFNELQGFRVEIINNGGEQKILLTYEIPNNDGGDPKEETLEIDKKIIEEIIEERKKFEEKVEASAGKIKK